MLRIIPLTVGERVELKKPHPCGNRIFEILRVGSEVRVRCTGCGRDMTLDRIKLEKAIARKVPPAQDADRKEKT